MSIKRQLSLALIVGVGSTLVGCKSPMGSGLAFWKSDDPSVASTAPDAATCSSASLTGAGLSMSAPPRGCLYSIT